MRTNRLTSLAMVVGATAALTIPAGAALAAPGTDCPPGGSTAGYPGTTCTAAVSDSTVTPGEPITVSGSGFQAGTAYTITFHSTPQVLATGTVPASGTVTDTVKIPADATAGQHTIVIDGVDASGGPRELTTSITVVNQGAARTGTTEGTGTTTGTSPTSGALPSTGSPSSMLPLVGTGAGLVIVGAGAVAVSRRRRSQA